MKTYAPRPRDIERRWYVVDGDGAVLGRLASEVAMILRGKHKPIFAPHADTGDHVVVINAKGVRLTGGKEEKKVRYRHSGYPGGLTETKYFRLMRERPSLVVEKAVRGMLPKNSLGREMARKLSVFDGPEHAHSAQKPLALKLGEIPKWDGLPKPIEKPAPKKRVAEARPGSKAEPKAKAAPARRGAADKDAAKKPAAKRTTSKRTTSKRTTAKSTAKKRTTRKKD